MGAVLSVVALLSGGSGPGAGAGRGVVRLQHAWGWSRTPSRRSSYTARCKQATYGTREDRCRESVSALSRSQGARDVPNNPYGDRPWRVRRPVRSTGGIQGYEVRDPPKRKIGSVEELFVNHDGEPEYVKVNMNLLGFKTVLIPVAFATIDKERRIAVLQ